MVTFLTILHVVVCLFLILVVLLQAGKGGGMGIAFGGGGSQTVFGSSGAGNFLTRLTSVTAVIFLMTSLGLAHYASQQDSKRLQALADRKAVEKKSEDERAAKLKADLDKARTTIEKTATEGAGAAAGTAPASNGAPAATTTVPASASKPAATTPAAGTLVKPLKGATPPAGKPVTTGVGKPAPAAPDEAPPKPAPPAQ